MAPLAAVYSGLFCPTSVGEDSEWSSIALTRCHWGLIWMRPAPYVKLGLIRIN